MKRYIFIVFFALILFFAPRVNAETITGVATIGRGAVMDTSNTYTYTDYKTLSSDSINALPINAFTSATDFYIMGAEYSYAIALTGQTNFAVTVRVPVATDTIYNYTLTDGLNQNDFKVGISPNFSVYNITPTITSFGKVNGVYSRNGVAHTYIYYDVVFNFVLDQPLTGSYNLNFAMLNTTGNRSTYYYSGGSPGTTFEFPVAYNTGQTTPDAVLFSTMSPSVSMSTGTTGNNQDIIDANNENTELIINNQNENTEALQETIEQSYENLVKSQEVCSIYDSSSLIKNNTGLSNNGLEQSQNGVGVTDFISINNSTIMPLSKLNGGRVCFYNVNKSFISCILNNDLVPDSYLTIPISSSYVRFTISMSSNLPTFKVCQNGNQASYDFQTQPFDDNIGANLFPNTNWYENSHFSSIITAPISFLNSLNTACQPIVLTYRNQNISLPCGTTIFWDLNNNYISTFRAFWNVLFAGLIIYRLALKLIMTVNDCLDPTKDKVGGFDI